MKYQNTQDGIIDDINNEISSMKHAIYKAVCSCRTNKSSTYGYLKHVVVDLPLSNKVFLDEFVKKIPF